MYDVARLLQMGPAYHFVYSPSPLPVHALAPQPDYFGCHSDILTENNLNKQSQLRDRNEGFLQEEFHVCV